MPGSRVLPPRGSKPGDDRGAQAAGEGVAPDGTHRTRRRSPTRSARTFGSPPAGAGGRDLRLPRPARWERPLGALRLRHATIAIEITDPAEAELPAVGHLALVDPETGDAGLGQQLAPQIRERFAELERERREAVACELRRLRHRSRRARPPIRTGWPSWDAGSDELRRPHSGCSRWRWCRCSLLWQRAPAGRRTRYAVRFPAVATLSRLCETGSRWAAQVPAVVAVLAAMAASAVALARPQLLHRVPIGPGIVDAGSGPLGVDGRQRCRSDPSASGDPRGEHLHRSAAVERARRRDRLLQHRRHRSTARHRPRARPQRDRQPVRRTAAPRQARRSARRCSCCDGSDRHHPPSAIVLFQTALPISASTR